MHIMLKLINGANNEIRKLANKKNVRACYLSVCVDYEKSYRQNFVKDMQTLITKLGQIISMVTKQRPYPFCAQNIDFLCNEVAGRRDLKGGFDYLQLNNMGNRVKHSIEDAKIDMDLCVKVYNDLVRTIAKQYNLPALTEWMLIKARHTQNNAHNNKNNNVINNAARNYYANIYGYAPRINDLSRNSNVSQNAPVASDPSVCKQGIYNDISATADERITLRVILERGNGKYTEGFIRKVDKLNFVVNVSITNPDNLPIKSVIALFRSGSNKAIKHLGKALKSSTEIDLEASKFSGNIKGTVTVTYKIGMLKTKKLATTVFGHF